jgi:hypothetical protein
MYKWYLYVKSKYRIMKIKNSGKPKTAQFKSAMTYDCTATDYIWTDE